MSKLSLESFDNLSSFTGEHIHQNSKVVNRAVLKQLILDANRYRWLRYGDNGQ